MSEEVKVAIIDDDGLSSHNWNILLKFVGEEPLILTGENWQQEIAKLDENNILAVMIVSLMESELNETAVVELVKTIREWNSDVPVFLSEEDDALGKLLESDGAKVFDLPDQSDYQGLLKVLEQARKVGGL